VNSRQSVLVDFLNERRHMIQALQEAFLLLSKRMVITRPQRRHTGAIASSTTILWQWARGHKYGWCLSRSTSFIYIECTKLVGSRVACFQLKDRPYSPQLLLQCFCNLVVSSFIARVLQCSSSLHTYIHTYISAMTTCLVSEVRNLASN
jgi:hypothetical protein